MRVDTHTPTPWKRRSTHPSSMPRVSPAPALYSPDPAPQPRKRPLPSTHQTLPLNQARTLPHRAGMSIPAPTANGHVACLLQTPRQSRDHGLVHLTRQRLHCRSSDRRTPLPCKRW